MSIDYDQDFFAWSQEQARLLRSGRFSQLDVTHLVEEIGDLGKRERRALESRLAVLIGYLLKWRYQPDYPNGNPGERPSIPSAVPLPGSWMRIPASEPTSKKPLPRPIPMRWT